MRLGRLAGVIATALVMAVPVRGVDRQEPSAPVFKSGGITVPVHATVTDASRRLVTDLPAEAFTVFDNGVARPITVFERKVLPLSVLLVLDTSESMRESIGRLRDAARQFIAQMRPGDRVEIGAFNNSIRWVRPFTSDQRALNRILDFLGPNRVDYGTALWPAIHEGLQELNTIADGRKVLLIFSDGEGNIGRFTDHPILSRAIVDNVMIYAISMKTEYVIQGRRGKSVLDARLPMLAEETGGGYFELDGAANLAATFTRVSEELHHQYSFAIDAAELDGKTHTIAVEVKGEGLTARARRSYLASHPK